LWAAVAVSGQELSRTQISDTLFNADGSRAVGSLRIAWKSFTAADGSTVAKNSVNLDIVDGIVAVALAPNLGAVPDGTYYSVEYRLHRGERSNEHWIVPDSQDPVSIADIRILSVPAAGMSVSLSQVNGLPAALSAKADRDGPNTFVAPQVLKEDAPGTSNPLLGLQKSDGAAGVYFRLPELSGDVTYTLPPNAGSPNQALTTDGGGALFWSSAAGGGAGSGSAYEVLQQGGTSVTQRTVANFASSFLVSDNSGQLRTDIAPNFGTATGTITQGNDSRLSNARTPLGHASTHATGSSDPVTPASIGALNRTNDLMVGTSPTTPVLKVQGSIGQSAALQEWRDGNGGLAASITAQGSGFFRELGVSAPVGGTTVSEFFEIGGLKKFALSATDGVFDVLRYDNAGAFLDRPLRVFRSGKIETTVSMKVADAGVGSGALGLTGNYVELQGVSAPSNPTSGFGRVFLNSTSGEVSIKKSSGSIVSLEGGGDEAGDYAWTGTHDFTGGTVTLPSGVGVGSGTIPFNLTGYTDDVAPSAPGTANQFTSYVDRASGLWSWIINGGSAQTALTVGSITVPHTIGGALTSDRVGNGPYPSSGVSVETVGPAITDAGDGAISGFDFDGTTDECLVIYSFLPSEAELASDIEVNLAGTAAAGVSNDTLRWCVQLSTQAAGASKNTWTYGAASCVTTASIPTNNLTFVTRVTLTNATHMGQVTVGEPFAIRICRDPADAGDTLAFDALLRTAMLTWYSVH
ncbi:MAG: hypothetical protein O3A53_19025, partial [Acidobacteria bacterium]|nr:hypothetical protein [Acidobacteriota bacterium]